VWLIANKHGITIDQLRNWNNLKSDLIHPNQKLIVSQASGTSTGTTTKPVTATNKNVGTTTKPTTATNTNNDSNSSNATTTTAKTYTVKAGDSVWLIANTHGITIDQLRNWNNLKSDLIHPNQTLKVSNASTSSNTTAQTTTNTSNEQSHKVVSGDSLWMLSQKYNLSIAQLKTLNSLTSDTIYVGQTLKVR
jgi:LysM repeat protein